MATHTDKESVLRRCYDTEDSPFASLYRRHSAQLLRQRPFVDPENAGRLDLANHWQRLGQLYTKCMSCFFLNRRMLFAERFLLEA
jgi:hypothetical protein